MELTALKEENMRSFFGFYKWSRKVEIFEQMLQTIEIETAFVTLTHDCTRVSSEKEWHKMVYLHNRYI